eukprot:1991339-Rhodomonas_salina.1
MSSTESNSTECLCDPGHKPSETLTNCSACAPGQFKNSTSNVQCESCGAGSFQGDIASISCISCPENTNSPAESDGIEDCICNIGYEGSGCSACAVGFYKPTNGSGTCSGCAAGTYLNVTGGSACLGCPAGTFQDGNASTACDCHNVERAREW